MRRAYILILIVAILVFSAFAVSFGWYYYAKQTAMKIVGIEEKGAEQIPAVQEQDIAEKQVAVKKAVLKIGEKAAYRKPSGAQVVVEIQNAGSYAGTAE